MLIISEEIINSWCKYFAFDNLSDHELFASYIFKRVLTHSTKTIFVLALVFAYVCKYCRPQEISREF